jgi:hypothetical protein
MELLAIIFPRQHKDNTSYQDKKATLYQNEMVENSGLAWDKLNVVRV